MTLQVYISAPLYFRDLQNETKRYLSNAFDEVQYDIFFFDGSERTVMEANVLSTLVE